METVVKYAYKYPDGTYYYYDEGTHRHAGCGTLLKDAMLKNSYSEWKAWQGGEVVPVKISYEEIKPMTIDRALEILQKAEEKLGGSAPLVLSLTRSGIADAGINNMEIIQDGDSQYVEVQCEHEDLTRGLSATDQCED